MAQLLVDCYFQFFLKDFILKTQYLTKLYFIDFVDKNRKSFQQLYFVHKNPKEISFHAVSSRFVLINVEFDRDDFEKLVEVEIQYKKKHGFIQ